MNKEYSKEEFDAELDGMRCLVSIVSDTIAEGIDTNTAKSLPSAMFFLSKAMDNIYEKGNALLMGSHKGGNENE